MGTNPSEELKKQVESRILALENRMKELMFWEEAKNLAYTGVADDTLPPREFPSTDMVHYFHPLSWVRQMKLILGSGVPPWMDYLFEEYKTYKDINEDSSPLKERITDHYHMSTTYAPAH